MRHNFVIIILMLFSRTLISQISGHDVLKAIRNDQFDILKIFLKQDVDPNGLYGNAQVPLLHYAVSLNKVYPVKVLLDNGANIENLFDDQSPLMIAVRYRSESVIKVLLKRGADIDKKNTEGETAFIIAAKKNYVDLLGLLKENNVTITIEDNKGYQAIDYAYKMQNVQAYSYLKSVTESKYEKLVLPNYFDGPYATWKAKNKLEIAFFFHDSQENKTYLDKANVVVKKEGYVVDNKGVPFDFNIVKSNSKNPDYYNNVEKIFAVGDLHGGFDDFKKLLINNKIINKELNWIWGNGHLVFVGDVFDRGDKVTECFWLIYKLEKEAIKLGGNVHLVLGNHEIMQLTGDKRYLAEKYIHLCNRLNFDYTNLYGHKSVLGKWIRTKNTIITINDILFVHGGISQELIKNGLTIEKINSIVKEVLKRKDGEPKSKTEELILGANGPLWYRGFLKFSDAYYKSTGGKFSFNEGKLDKILQFYNVKTIVFANTNVKAIKPLYNFKLYGIDIPFSQPGVELQGLMWEKGHFYRALIDGTKQILY
ncbi:MAG: ankyrin repeat domain-containing protein [Bacteroidota bacterium]